jgi:NADPH:quinone reductase-like Zn-dependent oxidoreductase
MVRQRLTMYVSRHRQADLDALNQLIEAGQVTPVIGQTYQLSDAPAAIRRLAEGHAQGKLVITT